jgi:Spy/CpxP family protein refolding chaperone
MRQARFLPTLALLVLAGALPVYAQAPQRGMPPGGNWGGSGMGGGGGRRDHNGQGRWPGGQRPTLPSDDEVEGPPTPSLMRTVADLDDEHAARYAQAYDQHMTTTEPWRDSLRTAMRSLRSMRESGDRDAMRAAMREQAPEVSRLWDELAKQDQSFDKGLKKVLTKEQRKQYEKWRDEEKKAREAQQPERDPDFGGGSGGSGGRRGRAGFL